MINFDIVKWSQDIGIIVPVLERRDKRQSNDQLSATLGRDGILTQVCYIPNSFCFHCNRLLPRGLLMPCYLPDTSYYI